MKKLFVVLTAMAFVIALGLPAMAEVEVIGSVDKIKTKDVIEIVYVDKTYIVDVKQKAMPENSAEAEVVKNDLNMDNVLIEDPVTKEATIEATALNGNGVIGINQAPGSMNNQGNATAVAVSADGSTFLHSQSSVAKVNTGNIVDTIDPERTNSINGALTGAQGILGVNQSAGSINNQDNATSMAVGCGSMAALSEADLGMVNSRNVSTEAAGIYTDIITASLDGGGGVVGVNQSSGCMNNQANVVAVSLVGFDSM